MWYDKKKKGMIIVIHIGIIDDNELVCRRIKKLIDIYSIKNSVVVDVYMYQNESNFLSDINLKTYFDLIYLDIELTSETGIAIGHKIREYYQDEWMQIVFISGKEVYERQLFEINCLDFLSKQILYEHIERTLNRFQKLTRSPKDVFSFQRKHMTERVPISDILYFESENRKVLLITQREVFDFYDKLDDIEQKMPIQFYRIHKSFLVNYYHIRNFNYDHVIMSNGKQLPISQSKRKEMRDVQLEIEQMEELSDE